MKRRYKLAMAVAGLVGLFGLYTIAQVSNVVKQEIRKALANPKVTMTELKNLLQKAQQAKDDISIRQLNQKINELTVQEKNVALEREVLSASGMLAQEQQAQAAQAERLRQQREASSARERGRPAGGARLGTEESSGGGEEERSPRTPSGTREGGAAPAGREGKPAGGTGSEVQGQSDAEKLRVLAEIEQKLLALKEQRESILKGFAINAIADGAVDSEQFVQEEKNKGVLDHNIMIDILNVQMQPKVAALKNMREDINEKLYGQFVENYRKVNTIVTGKEVAQTAAAQNALQEAEGVLKKLEEYKKKAPQLQDEIEALVQQVKAMVREKEQAAAGKPAGAADKPAGAAAKPEGTAAPLGGAGVQGPQVVDLASVQAKKTNVEQKIRTVQFELSKMDDPIEDMESKGKAIAPVPPKVRQILSSVETLKEWLNKTRRALNSMNAMQQGDMGIVSKFIADDKPDAANTKLDAMAQQLQKIEGEVSKKREELNAFQARFAAAMPKEEPKQAAAPAQDPDAVAALKKVTDAVAKAARIKEYGERLRQAGNDYLQQPGLLDKQSRTLKAALDPFTVLFSELGSDIADLNHVKSNIQSQVTRVNTLIQLKDDAQATSVKAEINKELARVDRTMGAVDILKSKFDARKKRLGEELKVPGVDAIVLQN